MRERVHARCCGDLAGKAKRQFCIQNRTIGHQIAAYDALFGMQAFQAEHRHVRDFAAGSCRRGDENLRQPGAGHLLDAKVILGLAAIGRDHRCALGGIDRAAPAQPDNQVDALARDETRAGVDTLDARVGFDIAPDPDIGTGKQRYDAIRNARLEQAGVGHDQHARAAEPRDFLRQCADRTAALDQPIDIVKDEILLHMHLRLFIGTCGYSLAPAVTHWHLRLFIDFPRPEQQACRAPGQSVNQSISQSVNQSISQSV